MSKRSSFEPTGSPDLDIQIDKDVQATYTNIEKVANIADSVDKVGQGMTNVNTVGANIDKINIVETNIEYVKTTALNITNVDTVSQNIENINNVVNNLTDISQSVASANEINGLLGVDLGTASIDLNGDLLLSQIKATSIPAINNNGILTITYV